MLSNDLISKYNIDVTNDMNLCKYIQANNDEAIYIVNLSEVIDAFKRWKEHLPLVKPYYAMKCNPDPVIIELLVSLGCKFDCASKLEIEQILNLTNDPSSIIFAHPCKYISHLNYAKEKGVNLMTFDCEEELYKIKKYYPNAKLLLRLAVDDSQSLCKFNIKFGCKQDNVLSVLQLAKDLNMNLVGFSFHVGSGCKSAYTYFDALRICKEATVTAINLGFAIDMIDLGGGFMAHTDGVCFEEIAKTINNGIDTFFSEYDNIQFIAEPGRFFVQKSYTLIICVVGKKKIEDKFIYYINDGVYGSFNCIIFDHQTPKIIPVAKHDNVLYESQIFGNTCDSLDEVANSILLPELDIGDYLYVPYFGAYTSSARSDGFNGYKVNHLNYICVN
jgi:ornithine decarboxylase